jgi:uncharacterized membrane protein YdbT with pleckstrin-like domain
MRGEAVPYPDHLLASDEQVVKHLHPHWLTLVAPIVTFVAAVGLGSYLAAMVPAGSFQHWLRGAVGILVLIVLVWLVLAPVLRWKTTHYVITTHRVLLRTGVLNHVGRDIPLQRINDVAFEQTLLDRLIGAGTLQVESAGETGQTVLRNIPHSDDVQQLINRLVNEQSRRGYGYGYGYEPPPDDWRTRPLG